MGCRIKHIKKKLKEKAFPRGELKIVLTHKDTGEEIEKTYRNIVVNVGTELITKRLTGEGNTCEVTYGAVGTDDTAATAADTALGTELARKLLASRTYTATSAIFILYMSVSEGNGALKEFALYGDGASGTPDSGVLFNRALIDVAKSTDYSMTIQATITFTG